MPDEIAASLLAMTREYFAGALRKPAATGEE